MTKVTLANHAMTIEVVSSHDGDTEQVLVAARELATRNITFVAAFVDRFDGLVIVSDNGTAWHFQSTLCGYEGTGTHATAEVLSLLDFGSFN